MLLSIRIPESFQTAHARLQEDPRSVKSTKAAALRRPRLLGSESTSEGFGGSDYIRSVYHVVTMQKSSRIMRMLLKVAMGPLMDSKKLSVSV